MEDAVRRLEKQLSYARQDPHGKLIPSLSDLRRHGAAEAAPGSVVGYGRPRV